MNIIFNYISLFLGRPDHTWEEAGILNKEQFHGWISDSTGNESNICQIHAMKDGETVFDDCWHGFRTEDAMNVNSVTKGVVSILAGIALDHLGGRNGITGEFRYATLGIPYLKLGERFGFMNYGYLWYQPYDNREVYAAIGDSGNIIYVNKAENVSVGITGTFKPRIFDRVDLIDQKVLPMIQGGYDHA